jgi:hypothetical protein
MHPHRPNLAPTPLDAWDAHNQLTTPGPAAAAQKYDNFWAAITGNPKLKSMQVRSKPAAPQPADSSSPIFLNGIRAAFRLAGAAPPTRHGALPSQLNQGFLEAAPDVKSALQNPKLAGSTVFAPTDDGAGRAVSRPHGGFGRLRRRLRPRPRGATGAGAGAGARHLHHNTHAHTQTHPHTHPRSLAPSRPRPTLSPLRPPKPRPAAARSLQRHAEAGPQRR